MNFQKAMSMTIEEKINHLGITPDQITKDTYVYVSMNEETGKVSVNATEKSDHKSYLDLGDETEIYGEYVTAYGYVNEMKKYLRGINA